MHRTITCIPTSLPVSSARLSDCYICITCVLPQWLVGVEKHSRPDQGSSLPRVIPASTAVNWTACRSSAPHSTTKPSRSASQTSTLQSPSLCLQQQKTKISRTIRHTKHSHALFDTELRSCVKVEVAVLGSRS